MCARSLRQVLVYKNVLLDGRLALFHQRQRWLAVADLHFGYELSHRAAGNLFPLWGMRNIQARLDELLRDYKPKALILLGDLVHDRAGAKDLSLLIKHLERTCDVVLISGNHDRPLKQAGSNGHRFVDFWRCKDFYFHHGDCETEVEDCIQIIGHRHPTGAIRDGAGLRLKLPAFIQEKNCWIMPAFSPWAAGAGCFDEDDAGKVWLCSPDRILPLERPRGSV